jgi:putative redox protein
VPNKTVRIEALQNSSFQMVAKAGNHQLIIDQPKTSGGTDTGPNPLEYSLVSLAGCIGAIGRIIAIQRKMDVRSFNVVVEAELDTDNLLGLSREKRAGFSFINVSVNVDADMTLSEKDAFLHEIHSRCPISDCFVSGTVVNIKAV